MAEYIEREALRDELLNISIDISNLYGCGVLEGLDRATKRLNKQLAADVAPVVHGRWIEDHDYLKCPECSVMVKRDFTFFDIGDWNYCPNCGAKMDGTERS